MLRLIIAIVVGVAIAIGGTVLVVNVVSSHGNGTPGNSSTYNYGSRGRTCYSSTREAPCVGSLV